MLTGSAHKQNKMPPSLLASLSPVAHILIICEANVALYLTPTLTFNQPDSYLLATLLPNYLYPLCSFICVEQEQLLLQANQMAGAWQWNSDH